MKLPIVLRVYRGDKLEAVKQFTDSQVVIGSSGEVQMQLADASVSPLHAVIEERDSTYYISDLGSQGGTVKNGLKLLEEPLRSGDEVHIGPYRLQFFIGVPKPVAPQSIVTSSPPSALPEDAPPAPPVVKKPSVVFPQPPPVSPPKAASVIEAQPAVGMATVASVGRSYSGYKKIKGQKTFAPPSEINDLKHTIKPGKGTTIEVVVAWKERIISTHHFYEKQTVCIGSGKDNDIVVPVLRSVKSFPLLKIGSMVTARIRPEMTGEFYQDETSIQFNELMRQNRLRNSKGGYEIDIGQGEMLRLGFEGDLISVYIRYIEETPKPLMAPLLDLTASEITGVILAFLVAGIFGLYMALYAPSRLADDDDLLEESLRMATINLTPPRPRRQVVEMGETTQERKVVRDQQPARQTQTPTADSAGAPGRAAEVAPKQTPDQEKRVTSARPGAAIKTGEQDGASAQSQKPDPTQVGMLSVFGSRGTQNQLDQAYTGGGELQGMAQEATGTAGSSEDRAGDQLGTRLRDTGAGGAGTATVGISGVGTQGRGTGTTGYGVGGIGQRGSVEINVGGQGAEFVGSMDREAIRRVILNNIRAIRSCYERVLQRKPDLYGKIVLAWDIEAGGQVQRATVKSNELGDDEVANCLVSRLRTWRFPEPPENQIGHVNYPFVFASQ